MRFLSFLFPIYFAFHQIIDRQTTFKIGLFDLNLKRNVAESNRPEDPLEAPELKYMNPSFWEDVVEELAENLGIEPEETIESVTKQSESTNEGN
jgi:hypothetical protein